MTDAELGFTKSLWSATAEEAPETRALSGSIDADVVIVGAGFTRPFGSASFGGSRAVYGRCGSTKNWLGSFGPQRRTS